MMLTKKSALLAVTLVLIAFYATTQMAVAYGGATVNVVNFAYQPSPVTVQVGDTVTWNNTEGFHSVDADDGSFGNESGSGWTFTHTFTAPGTYEYFCDVHSTAGGTNMNGVVIVEAPTAVTISDMGVSSSGAWLVGGVVGLGMLVATGLAVRLRRKQA
jgi:plastocyanin